MKRIAAVIPRYFLFCFIVLSGYRYNRKFVVLSKITGNFVECE